jgi:hypothetical protein
LAYFHAVAAVSIAEYRVGIELADTPARAADRARALAAITSVVDVLDYTQATAGPSSPSTPAQFPEISATVIAQPIGWDSSVAGRHWA